MQDGRLLAVQKGKRIGELAGPGKDTPFREELAALARLDHQSPQIIAGNKIHHQKITLLLGKEV
jgi:hypothetical protein